MFRYYKKLAESAMAQVADEQLFAAPDGETNSIAITVKHIAGNMRSRWTDFLTTDGEKPDRQRDTEFEILAGDSRDALMQRWQTGWSALENTLGSLSNLDLDRTITIRGEVMSAREASLRSVTHTAYHVGQILYLARLFQPDRKWLTIPPGQSSKFSQPYLERTSAEKQERP